jgi:Tfp pilus assembly protein PilV
MLIEVIISSLLVGVMVIATLTGFDVVHRTTIDERHRNEAAALAAQSQEQLRSDPASALNGLINTPNIYTKTLDQTVSAGKLVGGTTFTITQEAKAVSGSGQTSSCTATNTTAQSVVNFEISSKVSWPQQASSKRAAVKQASVISPPTGSSLELDVQNAPTPTAGIAGITGIVSYTPVGSTTPVRLEGVTGASGCIVFTGIQATSATVEVEPKTGYVTPTGLVDPPAKAVTIAPNYTTHTALTFNLGGSIKGLFRYKGQATAQVIAGQPEAVKGETFIALNTNIGVSPNYQVGSTRFSYEAGEEEKYKALNIMPAESAKTAGPTDASGVGAALYPQGDLFPFPSSKWVVYAGDCTRIGLPLEAKATEPIVLPGAQTVVEVPVSYLLVNVKKGTSASPGSAVTTPYEVKITSTECESTTVPDNSTASNFVHTQSTTALGHLSNPFQPFGKSELCLQISSTKRYKTTFTNNTSAGSVLTIFPEETPAQNPKIESGTEPLPC